MTGAWARTPACTRGLLAAVTLLLALVPTSAGGQTDDNPDAGRPAVWRGRTGVNGMQVAFDPEPFLPV
ncbi:MAG: hypothetical protein ACRDJP_11165, partial [Actinomycetota bacterium]